MALRLRRISKSFAVGPVFFTLCFLLLSTGCFNSGPTIAEVSGTVTFNGKPASGLVIYFIPQSGLRTSGGSTDNNGKFRLIYDPRTAGAIVGTHSVGISVQGDLAKALAGTKASVTLSKVVEVAPSGNNFDLKLEEFEVKK